MGEKKKNKGLVWLIVILIVLVLGLAGYIVYDKVLLNDKTPINNNRTTNIQSSTIEQEIDNNKIENAIKKALIEKIAKDEYNGILGDDNSIYAEGHRTLRTEFIDNKIHVYVLAQIGTYTKENDDFDNTSGMAGPFVIVLSNTYDFISYNFPEDGNGWTDSLKKLFPSDLVNEALNVNYNTDYYQNQIKNYLD